MEQKVQASEWAKLKLVGRPIMTSRDLWVAVRPLPRLLHLYCDSNLRALLRFPEDPIFLMFAPSGEEGEHFKVPMSEPGFASLLVITSDGCLWWISHINSYESNDRPAKRHKKNLSREPRAKFKKGTKEEWDIFEDCDIYKDIDSYPSLDVLAGSELALTGSSKTRICCKLMNLRASENAFGNVQARCIQPEALIGKFPGACIAASGPDNLIAVASSSRSPFLLTWASLSVTDITPAPGTSSSDDFQSNRKKTPSCLLFATMKNSKNRSQCGAVLLSQELFNALAQCLVGVRPKHLLLQGNSAGEVHVFPIDYPNPVFSSMVLCDLQEPISNLIAFPLHENSDALLVLSAHGCLMAITASKSKCTGTPFIASVSENSLMKLFQIDVKDAFDVHSWRVKAPVVSATLYGSKHLCICSASSVCIVNILENVDGNPAKKSSHEASTRATSSTSEEVSKKSFVCKAIPIHDILVAVAGLGPFVSTSKAISLAGLTSRGRLVALRIADGILAAENDCCILKDQVKSWKPRVDKRDENMVVLLDEIAAIEASTEALQVMKKSIDLAISELAIALGLTYNVLSCRDRYTVQAPHRSLAVPLMAGLHCDLEVNPVIPMVSSKRLCFCPGLHTQTSKSWYTEDVKLCLKVTLSNHGPYPVSSYWALLLNIQGLKEASSITKMYFSSIINDGYGLAPGVSDAMAFEISFVEESLNPLEASVYLCHIEENHDHVLQASPTCMKHLLKPIEASSRNTFKNGNMHVNSHAACILLARYRIDILSLLRPPRRLLHSSVFNSPHFLCPQGMGADAEDHDLRPFSAKFHLSFTRRSDLPAWTKLTAVEKWKEIYLEDLIKCCALSKNEEELSGMDVHDNIMLLTLDNRQLGREGLFSREIQISAPTPLIGCMVREAVLWRLKQHFGFLKASEPDKRGVEPSQNMDRVLSLLLKTQKELDVVMQDAMNLDRLWCANDLQQSDVAGQLVSEAHNIFKHIPDMYIRYRENDASNPFWRCGCMLATATF